MSDLSFTKGTMSSKAAMMAMAQTCTCCEKQLEGQFVRALGGCYHLNCFQCLVSNVLRDSGFSHLSVRPLPWYYHIPLIISPIPQSTLAISLRPQLPPPSYQRPPSLFLYDPNYHRPPLLNLCYTD